MESKSNLSIFIKLLKRQNVKINDIKSFLRNNVIDFNEYDKNGYTAFHYAIKSERPEIVKLLLDLNNTEEEAENPSSIKIDPNKETKDKTNNIFTSPTILSLQYLNDDSASGQIIRYLIEAGAKTDYKDEEGSTLFLLSCEKGRTDIIKFLIKKNENVINENSKNGGGLHYAIIGSKDEVIELLLENNIKLDICNSQGDNALEFALQEKQMNIFKTILDYITENKELTNDEKKKILNHQNNAGNTILHELSFAKSTVVTGIVLKLPQEIGVDPTLKNKEGYDYKDVSANIIELEKQKEEQKKRLQEERRKLKEDLKRQKYEEEKKILDEQKKYEEKMKRQEEFGQKLIENRGKVFLFILVVFLGLTFMLIRKASKKKEIII